LQKIPSSDNAPYNTTSAVFIRYTTLVGCVAVYSSLFATGYWIYGNRMPAMVLTVIAVGSSVSLAMVWPKLRALW
jgi:hypothetical protein